MNGNVIGVMLATIIAAAPFSTGVFGDERDKNADIAKLRTFRLDYGATLSDLTAGSQVRVWLPVPPSNNDQTVELLKSDLPVAGKVSIEPIYGNQILHFEISAPASGSLAFKTAYAIKRREVCGLAEENGPSKLTDEQRKLFLSANRKIPLRGRPLELLEGISFSDDALTVARGLYDRVDDHVRYDKSQPGYGNGDVLWVCDSRTGNCTDFHSLFISWARAKGLPARFEIGFPLPPERGAGTIAGYHCWASFHVDEKGWIPVDISEADKHPDLKDYYFGNLTENRVAFSNGRDIDLVPRQNGEPLNYFVYPYVEIDGAQLSATNVKLSVTYADVKEDTK